MRPRWAEASQPIAQFLAAFPVNLLFGAAVSLVLAYNLNPNIWLSFLIVFGTQWYIVFNTIGGASAFPNDLREAVANFRIRGWRWWTQVIIPAVAPYYLTGAITASGAPGTPRSSLNTSSGRTTPSSRRASDPTSPRPRTRATFRRIVLGVAMMSLFVTLFNRLFWRRLYAYAERRLRL